MSRPRPFLPGLLEERVGGRAGPRLQPSSSIAATCLVHGHAIEGEVEKQHVDARLAEQAERAALGVRVDQRAHAVLRRGRVPSATRSDLEQRGRRRDVRVEAAAGCGDQVDRHAARRRPRRSALSPAHAPPRPAPGWSARGWSRSSCRPRSRRPRRTGAGGSTPGRRTPGRSARSRSTSPSPTIRLPFACVRKDRLRDAGDRRADRRCRSAASSAAIMTNAGRSSCSMARFSCAQTRPRPVIARSIALMPTNGTISPPSP